MSDLVWVYCKFCGRKLFRADGVARVEIVCNDRRCKALQTVQVSDSAGGTGRRVLY